MKTVSTYRVVPRSIVYHTERLKPDNQLPDKAGNVKSNDLYVLSIRCFMLVVLRGDRILLETLALSRKDEVSLYVGLINQEIERRVSSHLMDLSQILANILYFDGL